MAIPPETAPPSPKPEPQMTAKFMSREEYYLELADRIEKHIRGNVIGVEAKKEIGYAVKILRQLGDSNAT